MRRINSSTASPNENRPGRDGFREGSLEQQIPTTHFTPDWCNSVQEELARTIELGGVAIDPDTHEQLATVLLGLRRADYVGAVENAQSLTATNWSAAEFFTVRPTSGNGVIHGFDRHVITRRKLGFVIDQAITIPHLSNFEAAAFSDVASQQGIPTIVRPGEFFEIFYGSNNWHIVSHGPVPPLRSSLRLMSNGAQYDSNTEVLYYDSVGGNQEFRRRVVMVSPLTGRGAGWRPMTGELGSGLITTTPEAIATFAIRLRHHCRLRRVRVGVDSVAALTATGS